MASTTNYTMAPTHSAFSSVYTHSTATASKSLYISSALSFVPLLLIFTKFTSKSARKYFAHVKPENLRNYKNFILGVHIVTCLTEMARWHYRALVYTNPLPKCDALDMMLCVIQVATSLWLTKPRDAYGNPLFISKL